MNLRRLVATLLFATTPACTATYRVAPAQYVPERQPTEIFVLDNAGFMYVLEQPVIVGERITGRQRGTPDTVSLAISGVREAMVQRKSPTRTVILVGGLTVTAASIALFARGKGDSCKLIWAQDDVPGKGELCENSDAGPPPP